MTASTLFPSQNWLSVILIAGVASSAFCGHKPEDPFAQLKSSRDPWERVELFLKVSSTAPVAEFRSWLERRGKDEMARRVAAYEKMYGADDAGAMELLNGFPEKDSVDSGLRQELARRVEIQAAFTRLRSDHFELRCSTDNAFLAPTLFQALETVYPRSVQFFGPPPSRAAWVVEIYSSRPVFIEASGQSRGYGERSGDEAYWHRGRAMVLSPAAVRGGYLWIHQVLREWIRADVIGLGQGKCPPWMEEGASRYFSTVWRSSAPFELSAYETALLTRAALAEPGTSQGLMELGALPTRFAGIDLPEKFSLAQAQAADAVDYFIQEFGDEKLRDLLGAYGRLPRDAAFLDATGIREEEFLVNWRESLSDVSEVPTDLARGALSIWPRPLSTEDVDGVDEPYREILRGADRHRLIGQRAEALREYKKLLDEVPDNGIALARLAQMHLQESSWKSAEVLLRRAVDRNPAYAVPCVMLGRAYYDQGRYDEAHGLLLRALEINPFDPSVHELLGLMAADVGNFLAARPSLEVAVRLRPENKNLRDMLDHLPPPR